MISKQESFFLFNTLIMIKRKRIPSHKQLLIRIPEETASRDPQRTFLPLEQANLINLEEDFSRELEKL